uniref:Zinc finger protein 414 n=1 Tax=Anas zonorhyncha TaxID=75864 RepID=A0A8B9UEI3_9AVES
MRLCPPSRWGVNTLERGQVSPSGGERPLLWLLWGSHLLQLLGAVASCDTRGAAGGLHVGAIAPCSPPKAPQWVDPGRQHPARRTLRTCLLCGTTLQEDRPPPPPKPQTDQHYACSSYGCKLAFPSMQELMDHLKVHYRPTQSLEGKTFQCPTLGCMETFPSMQDLMAHMKVHYKPNRYFKCENCLLRFRTHRSLFKHLHVCSDRAGSPAPPQKAEKPVPPATSALEKELTAKAPNLFGPSSLTRFSGPPPSSVPFLSYVHPSPYGLPPPPAQPRLRPFVPSHGPPVSNAIWKKSQASAVLPSLPTLAGHASNSRIVWEHTRGRYTCMQCPYSTASREEMTLHIEDHRKNLPPPGRLDADMGTALGGNREDAGGPSRVPTCSH